MVICTNDRQPISMVPIGTKPETSYMNNKKKKKNPNGKYPNLYSAWDNRNSK